MRSNETSPCQTLTQVCCVIVMNVSKLNLNFCRPSRSHRPPRPDIPILCTWRNAHIAHSHNDTSQGAIHRFEDEQGNKWTYTFDPQGTAGRLEPVFQEADGLRGWNPQAVYKLPDCDSNATLVSNSNSDNESSPYLSPRMPQGVLAMHRSTTNRAHAPSTQPTSVVLTGDSSNNYELQAALNAVRTASLTPTFLESDTDESSNFRQPPPVRNKHYYKFFLSPWHHIKVRFDRLELMALLDRNLSLLENCLSLFLSLLVSVCGIGLLSYGFYRDMFAFILCVTIAGCHYSLLKSVQPDASSPTHGYNRVVIYSRAVYFCLVSVAIFGLSAWLDDSPPPPPLTLYSVPLTNPTILRTIRDFLTNFLLFFPLLFTLGLFPQVNTYALYFLEQVDIHVFGGNAASSLLGAVYCVTRSMLTVTLVFGFAYGALCEKKQSQHILFSIFATLVITWSYHLSRSTGDPAVLWKIVKDEFREKPKMKAPGDQSGGETGKPEMKDDEFQDPLPIKLKQTVHARLINDVIVCIFIALLVFGIHCSSIFTTLQPDLNRVSQPTKNHFL